MTATAWISESASTPADGIRSELTRVMRAGLAFESFTFSIVEVDPALAAGKIFEFSDISRQCAQSVSREATE